MKKYLFLAALAAGLTLLTVTPSAQAQRLRMGVGVGSPGYNPGYGNPGFYTGFGNNYWGYGSRFASPYNNAWNYGTNYPLYSPYYTRDNYGGRPYSGGYYYTTPMAPSDYSYNRGFTYTPGSAADYASTPRYGLDRPAYARDSYPSSTYQSFYGGPGPAGNQAEVRIVVPHPEADVWIENQPTRQKGSERLFTSPPLQSGQEYTYNIRASWRNEDGREVMREKQVDVSAGRRVTVAFSDQGADVNARDPGADRPATDLAPQGSTVRFFRVVSVDGDRLVVTDLEGGNRRTHTLDRNAQILIGGNDATLEGLKPGMRVQFRTQDGSNTITRVEAFADRQESFEPRRENLRPARDRDLDAAPRPDAGRLRDDTALPKKVAPAPPRKDDATPPREDDTAPPKKPVP